MLPSSSNVRRDLGDHPRPRLVRDRAREHARPLDFGGRAEERVGRLRGRGEGQFRGGGGDVGRVDARRAADLLELAEGELPTARGLGAARGLLPLRGPLEDGAEFGFGVTALVVHKQEGKETGLIYGADRDRRWRLPHIVRDAPARFRFPIIPAARHPAPIQTVLPRSSPFSPRLMLPPADDFEGLLRVRPLTEDDYDAVVRLQQAGFPGMPPWTPREFASHLDVFPEGQLGVEYEGKLVGFFAQPRRGLRRVRRAARSGTPSRSNALIITTTTPATRSSPSRSSWTRSTWAPHRPPALRGAEGAARLDEPLAGSSLGGRLPGYAAARRRDEVCRSTSRLVIPGRPPRPRPHVPARQRLRRQTDRAGLPAGRRRLARSCCDPRVGEPPLLPPP